MGETKYEKITLICILTISKCNFQDVLEDDDLENLWPKFIFSERRVHF